MKVQLPSCLAAPDEAAVASTSQSMSVTEAFTGATVLVTGGTGYLGSLVRICTSRLFVYTCTPRILTKTSRYTAANVLIFILQDLHSAWPNRSSRIVCIAAARSIMWCRHQAWIIASCSTADQQHRCLQVIEQLLRVVPDVKRIYVIIRSKRGVAGAQISSKNPAEFATPTHFLLTQPICRPCNVQRLLATFKIP